MRRSKRVLVGASPWRDGSRGAATPAMTSPPPEIVLDTNVVLDCWVFGDAAAAPLAEAVAAGAVRWLVTAPMLAELADVLRRPLAARWERAREHALTLDFTRRCAEVVGVPSAPTAAALRCSDPDDQKFVDLAVQRRARWLLTHDRALLRLAGAARRHGVEILRPAAWRA